MALKKPDPPPRVLALAGDRGSAQAVAPVAARLIRDGVAVTLAAPSSVNDIFSDIGMSPTTIAGSDAATEAPEMAALFARVGPSLLLAGSSPARREPPATPEQFAILEARRRGVPSMAILDYWGMYRERFGWHEERVRSDLLPDCIGALDARCRDDLLHLGVPADRIVITHNPWLDRAVNEPVPPPAAELSLRGVRVLVVQQPLASISPDVVETFWRAVIETVADALAERGDPPNQLIVWRHPAQPEMDASAMEGLSRHGVSAMLSGTRGAAVLAHVDLLVTVHSTVAYEALHFGTPCVTLRVASADLPLTAVDDAGLTAVMRSFEQLHSFLGVVDPALARAELAHRRQLLTNAGVFFSDGQATSRCVQLASRLLAMAPPARP
jgi:hypothetical protein